MARAIPVNSRPRHQRRSFRYHPRVKKDVAALWAEGLHQRLIARVLGVSQSMVRDIEAMPDVQREYWRIRVELGELAPPKTVGVGGWSLKREREATGWTPPVRVKRLPKPPKPVPPRPPIDGRDERIRTAIQRLRVSRGRAA